MNKYVKGAMIFVGGVISGCVLGGALITRIALGIDTIREALKRVLSDRIEVLLFGGQYQPRGYILETVIFESREEAEAVLDGLLENIRNYAYTSVADFYDLADVNNNTYKNNKFGWVCLNKAKIVRIRNGYILDLPNPIPID